MFVGRFFVSGIDGEGDPFLDELMPSGKSTRGGKCRHGSMAGLASKAHLLKGPSSRRELLDWRMEIATTCL